MTCPDHPEHGAVYLVGERYFCPHAGHDRPTRTKALFTEEEVFYGHVKPNVNLTTPPAKRRRRK